MLTTTLHAVQHENTRQRLIDQLAPPPSHRDPVCVMAVEELSQLSDSALLRQALQIYITANVDGSLMLPDGNRVKIKDIIKEFAENSKSRDGNTIKRCNELIAVSMVDEFVNGTGTAVDDGIKDDGDSCDKSLDDG